LLFALLTVNGVAVLAYIGLWLLVPPGEGVPRARSPRGMVREALRDRHGDMPYRLAKLIGYLAIGAAFGSLLDVFGLSAGRHSLFPLSVAGVGALLIWWRAPQERRDSWASGARRYGATLHRRRALLLMAAGVVLVIAGVTSFLAANNALAQARAGAIGIGATLVGVLLVTGPWLLRLLRDLTAERRERIRAEERAEVAAHVHDSVLQTLALIQGKAGDPEAIRRLARRQERELRSWLYDGQQADAATSFAGALRAAAAEIEDEHGVLVEVVVVGDVSLDDRLRATVAAAREAVLNAAKASGESEISVFAEVADDKVEVFVRDRGVGFDLSRVPEDRRGIRDSIIGRMARHGGEGAVRSGSAGTEVRLSMSRASS
jgi:signal transduction histidine kinase